ncbi:hypothetical protein Syun_030360 [Stephania yunnanensis]|uniref:Uncharacterized protein n=1 Tax=Stephania yunnanensis TaxID=152371 RepID=A0AAP0E7B4_9MAGN
MATFKQNPKKRNRHEFNKNPNPSKNPNTIPLKSQRPRRRRRARTMKRTTKSRNRNSCVVEQSQGLEEDSEALSKHMKRAFGKSWKEVLCDGKLAEGGLILGTLRSLRPLTSECRAAKLFAKHMKVEEQVSSLKSRVNIASGTPSRIKKLIEIDALGLSRIAVLVLDMHTDAKGYSLFTLPQVSAEFWDLYNSYFHQKLVKGDLRICLYGPIPCSKEEKDALSLSMMNEP